MLLLGITNGGQEETDKSGKVEQHAKSKKLSFGLDFLEIDLQRSFAEKNLLPKHYYLQSFYSKKLLRVEILTKLYQIFN